MNSNRKVRMRIGATLCRLSSRQKARAKLRIQQTLVDVEFPDEQFGEGYVYSYGAQY